MKSVALLVAGMIAVSAIAVAQEGLYAPALPEDAALVRVANLSGTDVNVLDIGPLRYAVPGPGTVGPYRTVRPGIFIVGLRDRTVLFSPEPRSFTTVVLTPDGGTVALVDQVHTDPARAQLVFYNFSGRPMSFESLQPAAVFAPVVASGDTYTVVVNAIAVTIAAKTDDVVYVSEEVTLSRGSSFSLFADSTGGFLGEAVVVSE